MRLATVDRLDLEASGVRGDRRFYLVDDEGLLVNAKRVPTLLAVRPAVEDGRLAFLFPDGSIVEGAVRDSETRIETSFYGRPVTGRIVEGPWCEALSEYAGKPVRVARTETEGDGYDRGAVAGASLVSTGSLDAFGRAAGATQPFGRCSVTTRDPDTGVRDLDTLGVIGAYRADVPTGEPLPFGVWCEVVEPGAVAVGDRVEPG